MSRGISTVADALVFLLLVSAAMTTLAIPHNSGGGTPDAAAAATVVSHAETSVKYNLSLPATERFHSNAGIQRHVHGRLARLLARSAIRNATIDAEPLTTTSDAFERAVTVAVANVTGPRTQVTAYWTPFDGASVHARTVAGPSPPRDASVGSRVLRVSTAATGARDNALVAANRSGYPGVAAVAANATMEILWPREGMKRALVADYPTGELAAHRYRRGGSLLGLSLTPSASDQFVESATHQLRTRLTTRYERTLRSRYDTPQAAARAIDGSVTVVVRRWAA